MPPESAPSPASRTRPPAKKSSTNRRDFVAELAQQGGNVAIAGVALDRDQQQRRIRRPCRLEQNAVALQRAVEQGGRGPLLRRGSLER